jgi:hypothetical protein
MRILKPIIFFSLLSVLLFVIAYNLQPKSMVSTIAYFASGYSFGVAVFYVIATIVDKINGY